MSIDSTLQKYDDYLRINTTVAHLTRVKYNSIVRRFLLTVGLSFNLEKMNIWLADDTKKKRCGYYKYALKHFLKCIGRNDLAEKLVSSKIKPRQKIFKYIPKDTMSKILNSLEGKYKQIAFLQIKTGARVSEIITLRCENIDYHINPVMIQIKIGVGKSKSKRQKEKTLYLAKKYEPMLRKWVDNTYGYVFLSPEYESFNDEQLFPKIDSIRRELDKKLAAAGNWHHVDGLSSHYLRHLFSDYFLKAGGDPIYLKKALGHSRMDTTLGYVSIEDQMVQKVILGMEVD